MRLILPSRAFRARKKRKKEDGVVLGSARVDKEMSCMSASPLDVTASLHPQVEPSSAGPGPFQTQALCPCGGVGSSMAGLNSQGVSSATSLCRCGGFGCSMTGRTSQGAPRAISPGFPRGRWLLPACVHLVPCACGGFGCPLAGAPGAP